jgi:hypothetical protein
LGDQAALFSRRPVGTGTIWFVSVCVALSIAFVGFNGIRAGVGASGVGSTESHGVARHDRAAQVSTNRTFSSHYWGTDDVPPALKPVVSPVPTAAPAAPPAAGQVSTPPAPIAAPPPTPTPPPTPAALPARGAATAYGCAAALAYLAAYSAAGFSFQCPGSALGHQAMTCIDEAGVCDNERLIAIADPCPAAYMNEASNSWVLTGASDAPIDPYGACS